MKKKPLLLLIVYIITCTAYISYQYIRVFICRDYPPNGLLPENEYDEYLHRECMQRYDLSLSDLYLLTDDNNLVLHWPLIHVRQI